MENRRENRALGAHNWTIGCDFKESDGVGRVLTCLIVRNALWDKYNKYRIRSVGQWERKIGLRSEQTLIASDYVRQHQCHQTL